MGIDVALNDIKRLTPNYTVSIHLTHLPWFAVHNDTSQGDVGTERPSQGPLTQRTKKDFPRRGGDKSGDSKFYVKD